MFDDNKEPEPWEDVDAFVRFQSHGNEDSCCRTEDNDLCSTSNADALEINGDYPNLPHRKAVKRTHRKRQDSKAGEDGKHENSVVKEDSFSLIHHPDVSARRTSSGRVSFAGRLVSLWEYTLRTFEDDPDEGLELDDSDEDGESSNCNLNQAVGFRAMRSEKGQIDRDNVSANKAGPGDKFRRSNSVVFGMLRTFTGRASVMSLKTHVNYENTYRMEPVPGQFFSWVTARDMMQRLVEKLLPEFNYEASAASLLCKLLSQKITTLMKKKFEWPRYRYVCHVTIAQLNGQGIVIADRALWMVNTDNVAVIKHVDRDFVCVVTLHAIYFE